MPRCTTGGTFLLAIFLLQRACNAMQVEGVVTRTRQHRAVVAGDAAVRACRLELLSADATRVAFAVPHPFGDQVNAFHLHLHAFSVVTEKKKKEIIARNRYIRQSALLQTTTTTTTKRRKKKTKGRKRIIQFFVAVQKMRERSMSPRLLFIYLKKAVPIFRALT